MKIPRAKSKPTVSVIMTVYDTDRELIKKAISSVLNQTYPEIELLIVDDASTDASLPSFCLQYASSVITKPYGRSVKVFRTRQNYGTYVCRNFAITKASGRFITMCDSDDTVDKEYVTKLHKKLISSPHAKIVYCQTNDRHRNNERNVIAAVSSFFDKSLVKELGFFDSVRLSADTEFRLRCKRVFGNNSVAILHSNLYDCSNTPSTSLTSVKQTGFGSTPRMKYVRDFRRYHVGEREWVSEFSFPMKKRPFAVHKLASVPPVNLADFYEVDSEAEAPIVMKTPRLPPKNLKKPDGMLISANMATIPQRISVAEKAVASIIDQVDVVRIYLNNFSSVPRFIKSNPKIEYIFGDKDLHASGKHYWSGNPNEYYFTIDDDILYPKSYVEDSLRELNRYDDNVIISCHGRILPKKTSGYYSDKEIEVLHFREKRNVNRLCTVAGTGVSVRNTNKVFIDSSLFKHTHMDDIEVSIQANLQGIPLIVRKGESLKSLDLPRDVQPIFKTHMEQDDEQTKLYNSHNWKVYTPNSDMNKKISVLIAAYKAKDWIQDSIQSVLAQELPEGWELEVIVGVDGCRETFHSAMHLNDDRLGIVNFSENSGTYHTFNSILPFASGSILQRFDADDIMNQGWLHRVISTFELNPDRVVIYGELLCVSEDLKSATLPGPASLGFTEYKKKADGIASWRSSYFLDKLGCYKELPCGADTEALVRTEGFGHQPCLLSFCSFFRRVVPTALTRRPETDHNSNIRKKIRLEIQKDRQSYRSKRRIPQKLESVPKSGEVFGSLFYKRNYLLAKDTFRKFLDSKAYKRHLWLNKQQNK